MAEDLLFIEPDEDLSAALSVYIRRQQFDVRTACVADAAEKSLSKQIPDIVLANPSLPDDDGTRLLLEFKSKHAEIPLILLTDPGNLESAMEAFGPKADDYLQKPVKSIALDISLQHARQHLRLARKFSRYARQLEDLHEANTLYHQLFDEVPCYISVQDRQFRLTATNRLFKWDFGNEVGDFCYKIYKHRDTPCPECPVAKTFADGKRHQAEEVVTSRYGRQYNVMTWTAPLMDEHGEISQVMEMATNITQVRRLQDHLTSLGLMLGSMSHGVKGMMTALDGGVYQLETGIRNGDSERIQNSYERIADTSSRIRKMVLDILYYAKSRGMQYQTTDAARLAKSLADAASEMAGKQGVAFHNEIDPDTGEFEVDPDWFYQAVLNFLENAVDACVMDPQKPQHRIDFTVVPEDAETVRLEIADNGIGMDEESRRKMFTLFFSSKGSKGTGLGMYIANHIIAQHGGAIEVDSVYGQGTRVKIRVPRNRTAAARAVDSLLSPHTDSEDGKKDSN